MGWEGVTVSEQRGRFIDDYIEGLYSTVDLAASYHVSRKTAYKWIDRFRQHGKEGLEDLSRRPHSCPWQTEEALEREIEDLRKARPSRGPKKLLRALSK